MIYTVAELLEKHPLPPTPAGEDFILNPLQVEDIETGLGLERAGLFLPVGYGKTVISTLIALGWCEQYRIVLVPPILVAQWVLWINSIPNSGGAIGYEGSPKQRGEMKLLGKSWWVMSYGIFRNDLTKLVKLLIDRSFTTIVDECQNLKNVNSKLFAGVNTFAAGKKLLLLTGTEMNNPGDAYAYIKLKTPSIYRSQAHFENLHVEERDFFERPVKWRGLDIINQNLYANSLQRTKEEVHAHLPKANYQPLLYDLAPKHLKLYNQLAEEMIVELESGGKIDGSTTPRLRNALQQMVINWSTFSENPDDRSTFYDLLDQVMDEIDVQDRHSSKLIVWTWFQNTSRNITHYLNEIGVPAVAAYGEVDSKKSVKMFMEDPAWRVLVAQPGSAGAGLNPQYICWEALFAEVPTRTIPFRQSAGRIDREGQRFNPNIRIAQARGTVQTGMYADLLVNDGQVQKVQGNLFDLRKLVYG